MDKKDKKKAKRAQDAAAAQQTPAAGGSEETERRAFEQNQLEAMGTVSLTKGAHAIHCLTVIGQIEGHVEAPQGQKTTKYEHVIPQLVAVQEDPAIEGLLVLLNTVGGDVEAGLALAELIASISKPSAALVLGGGHSIGIPLAVSARRSFIVPTATMTVHPVRHSGMILGVPQTMRWFEQMQERITGFVESHSQMPAGRFNELMLHTGELVMDMGTVLDGRRAVEGFRGNPFLRAVARQKFLPPNIPLGTKFGAEPRTRRKAARTLSAPNFPVCVPPVCTCHPGGTFLIV